MLFVILKILLMLPFKKVKLNVFFLFFVFFLCVCMCVPRRDVLSNSLENFKPEIRCVCDVTVILWYEMELATTIQIQDIAVCVSLHTNTLEKKH